MTNEERDLLTSFVQRIAGAGAAPGSLPPVEPMADQLIADLFTRHPEARYRMTQTAFVQEAALAQAQARIQQLQAALEQAQRTAQAAQNAPAKSGGGFFGGLFGGGQPAAPAPVPQQGNPWGQPVQPQFAPQPQPYPQQPAYPPQMMQQGPGFFGSALRTAAGVAGGVVLADTLMGMFSGPHMGGGFGGGGFGGSGFGGAGFGGGGFGAVPTVNETTIINNYGDQAALPVPPEPPGWGGQQTASWDAPGTDSSGWQDASSNDDGFGGGFDDNTDV